MIGMAQGIRVPHRCVAFFADRRRVVYSNQSMVSEAGGQAVRVISLYGIRNKIRRRPTAASGKRSLP